MAALRARDEATAPPPVRFREDGERIVVYPSRWRLARHAVYAGMLALQAGVLIYLLQGFGPVVVVGLGFLAAFGLIHFLDYLPRLLWRWPALIVNSDGITDRASAGVTGVGLIPWHELESVVDAGRAPRGSYAELAISPISRSRLERRLPLLKRLFLGLHSALTLNFGPIYISSLFLTDPPAQIARRIASYVESHAPAGYIDPSDTASDVRRGGASDQL
jgi:hypothetical protein